MSIEEELPLPRYGLAGSFVGERLREGEGWDICSIVHRPADAEEELRVTVTRRTTARLERGAPRVAIPADAARAHVAMGLVLENPNAGDDLFAAAKDVASDDEAWKTREINVDGEMVDGCEREFGERWVAYYLTPLLIVSVLAPVALRPDTVELIRLHPDEIARMDTACLGDLESELLELCAAAPQKGKTTATLCEELSGDYDCAAVEAGLRGLVEQGLMTTSRGVFAGTQRMRDGHDERLGCEDWWVVTEEGHAAIGLPHMAVRKDE
ncbi:MAG: hypothetical protein ABR992_04675 [Solirubrobacteraceae bacterium]|jgi:hypothetical protein